MMLLVNQALMRHEMRGQAKKSIPVSQFLDVVKQNSSLPNQQQYGSTVN